MEGFGATCTVVKGHERQGSDVVIAVKDAGIDFVHHSGEFSDAGRTFDLYVAYGAAASPKTLSELWAILNGMSFTVSSSP